MQETKEITNLSKKEIEEQVKGNLEKFFSCKEAEKRFLDNVKNKKYFQFETGRYKTTIKIYVIDAAGIYVTKEALEKLDFYIDEKKYKENIGEYINILDYEVIPALNEYLEENINLPVTFCFTIDGDFMLDAIFDSDYILKKYKEKNICSTDASLDISLKEYSSIWETGNKYKFIHSNYDYDNNEILYQAILFHSKKDMLHYINEYIDDAVYSYIGEERSHSQIIRYLIFLKRNDAHKYFRECMHYISAIVQYYNTDTRQSSADIPLEILNREVKIND